MPAVASDFVLAKFEGMHKRSLGSVGQWHNVRMVPPMTARTVYDSARYYMNMKTATVKVWNAREQEAIEGLSKAEFFEKHGFVLLTRPTAMSADDWNASAPKPLGVQNLIGLGMPAAETPLSRKYSKEVEQIVRELLQGVQHMELDPEVVRRGPGTKNPGYNFAPHQDYGFTAEDWPLAGPEFHERLGRPDVRGLIVINFWRPVRPMRGPVQKTPLAVCDPGSVRMEDIVPVNVCRDTMGYIKMLDIAYNEDQRWYYYPDMTVDEVLVFKTFQYFKHQSGPELNTCFHTAFQHPYVPPGAEERHSCEYRVRIWL